MIIVTCGECGSAELTTGRYASEFFCPICEKHLELWNVKFVKFEFPNIEEVDATEEGTPPQD